MDKEVPTQLKGYVEDEVKESLEREIVSLDDYIDAELSDKLPRIEKDLEQRMKDYIDESLESSAVEFVAKSILKGFDNGVVEKMEHDLAENALKMIRNELKDYLTPTKAAVEKLAVLQAMDTIKEAVEECVKEKFSCDKYYLCDPETDQDYQGSFEEDEDPYDDNDDLFDDDQIFGQLNLNAHQPQNTVSPFDPNSPLANKSTREIFYGESCGLCDPFTGRSVRHDDRKVSGVGVDVKSPQSNSEGIVGRISIKEKETDEEAGR